MTPSVARAIAAFAALAAGGAVRGADVPAACRQGLPAALEVPPGHEFAFALLAEGVQIYACTAAGGAHSWVFQAPEADLAEAGGAAAGRHYAGPTWEASDGSRVVGAKLEGASPDPGAIPWLLLRAASHAGAGRMAEVAFVQRTQTRDGNAPAGGCDAGALGKLARVPYRAAYCFYRSAAR